MPQILIAIFLWSSLGILVRASGLAPQQIILFSAMISALCIGVGAGISQDLRRAFPNLRALLPMIVLGPLSLLNTFTFFYAYHKTTIANAILTHYIAPVLVAFIAPFALGERLTLKVLLSIVLASIGLWVMLDMSLARFMDLLLAGDAHTIGILSGLLSGVFYAFLIILVRVYAARYHPVVITFFQNIVITLILFPFFSTDGLSFASGAVVLTIGIVHSTVAPVLYFWGMRRVSANRAAILGYLEPVAAILLGLFILGESLRPPTILGGAMILLSGLITLRGQEQPDEPGL